jgi:[FeFe] hydrogenase H-cluster maturation GTPase HydF
MVVAKSERLHIGLFGRTNVGKSTIFNLIAGQNIAITSEIPGTTTDVVEKTLELSTLGPVVIFDTAGIDDTSDLGKKRKSKTEQVFNRCDIALLVTEANQWTKFEEQLIKEFQEKNIPCIIVINKKEPNSIFEIKNKLPKIIYDILQTRDVFLTKLTEIIQQELKVKNEKTQNLFDNLLTSGNTCIFVTPIDSGAPKGRLIMPQVQALRAALDENIISLIVQPEELNLALDSLKNPPDLIVCDSQVVKQVIEKIPQEQKITTFSILFARMKGDVKIEFEGIEIINKLKPEDKILIAEACTHHAQKDDIATVKIPNLLKKYLGFLPKIDYTSGHQFPDNLPEYKLVIHCGACMLTRTEKLNRIKEVQKVSGNITNYGMILSFLNGYLARTLEPFNL